MSNRPKTELFELALANVEALDQCKWRDEYDGNMTTSSGGYPAATLRLPTPQEITAIRFAPLNEDNRIKIGQQYRLYCWGKNGFEIIDEQIAKYHFLQFDSVPQGGTFLLQNLNEGSEILPFRIINGKQEFFYDADWKRLTEPSESTTLSDKESVN